MGVSYRRCPKCTFPKGVPIFYGYPTYEAFEQEKEGKLKLGGCVVEFDNPEFYCPRCEHEWTKEQAILSAYESITGIRASVGGFFQGFYEVDIDLRTGEVEWRMDREGEFASRQMERDEREWFRQELRNLDLLNWRRSYVEAGILDGTSWNVEIKREGQSLERSGTNQFPGTWDMFCLVIRAVSRKEFR